MNKLCDKTFSSLAKRISFLEDQLKISKQRQIDLQYQLDYGVGEVKYLESLLEEYGDSRKNKSPH